MMHQINDVISVETGLENLYLTKEKLTIRNTNEVYAFVDVPTGLKITITKRVLPYIKEKFTLHKTVELYGFTINMIYSHFMKCNSYSQEDEKVLLSVANLLLSLFAS